MTEASVAAGPALLREDRGKELPTMVLSELRQMGPQRQAEFFEEYERHRKKTWLAWLLWVINWHYVYLTGSWSRQFVQWLLFWPTIGIWWIVEGFRLPRRLRDQRKDVAVAVLRDLKIISPRS